MVSEDFRTIELLLDKINNNAILDQTFRSGGY